MFTNYFKIAWRNLVKNKTTAAINIIGLSTGLVCFILIFFFVQDEWSYDRHFDHPEQLYRVVKDFVNNDGSLIPDATTPPALAPHLQQDLPQVAQVTRLFPSWGYRYLLKIGDKAVYEQALMRVDSNFFKVFHFSFIKGNEQQALNNPYSIVMTEGMAKKYFGSEDALGKIVNIGIDNGKDFVVTGVIKDVPDNTHFNFQALIPLKFSGTDINTNWDWYNFYTYVRLREATDPKKFEARLQPLFKKYQPRNTNQFYAQAVPSIHLDSKLKWELGNNGDRNYLKIMLAIAFFVLLIAGINYVNLATARSVKRAKEVGIRKVAGAYRNSLIRQFLTESLLLALVSLAFSVFISALLLPIFNQLMGKQLVIFAAGSIGSWLIILGVTVCIGLAAGIYPAFYLSSYRPALVLKGQSLQNIRETFLRKGLVTFQFIISIVMIASIMIISRQLNYIRGKNPGFDKENVLILNNIRGGGQMQALKDELKRIPQVKGSGGANGIIGGLNWTTEVAAKGSRDGSLINFLVVDYDFLPIMDLQLKEGRNFSTSFGTDTNAVILNETAAKQLGLKTPVSGLPIIWSGTAADSVINYSTVVGVVKDFHFTNFHIPIKPFAFVLNRPQNSTLNTLFVKLRPGEMSASINAIQKAWARTAPGIPLDYTFQEEQTARLHESEMKFEQLFTGLTLLAILVACLGLFGLSAHVAEQRTKEIGVRKVLGANISSIVFLLSRQFILLMVIAICLAVPIAWYFMAHWLQDFAYRIDISWLVFLAAGAASLFIALGTVSVQAIRAAAANPVKSLRME